MGLGFEVFGEGGLEEVRGGRGGLGEEGHGGAEFERVDGAENFFCRTILGLIYKFSAFEEAWAKDGVGEIGLGFF